MGNDASNLKTKVSFGKTYLSLAKGKNEAQILKLQTSLHKLEVDLDFVSLDQDCERKSKIITFQINTCEENIKHLRLIVELYDICILVLENMQELMPFIEKRSTRDVVLSCVNSFLHISVELKKHLERERWNKYLKPICLDLRSIYGKEISPFKQSEHSSAAMDSLRRIQDDLNDTVDGFVMIEGSDLNRKNDKENDSENGSENDSENDEEDPIILNLEERLKNLKGDT